VLGVRTVDLRPDERLSEVASSNGMRADGCCALHVRLDEAVDAVDDEPAAASSGDVEGVGQVCSFDAFSMFGEIVGSFEHLGG
jgi:hypothetical protein